MRVVTRLEDLPGEIEAASAEALSAFGDGTVFCERYLASGRHIEVQIMADQHGTIWAVGERECSIQRRHQKVIEEAPSPLVERIPSMRAELFDAARKAAAAIAYVGAGTVEFLADEKGAFYFLEMNTRLQVEHPVTEETTGLDLVELQFAIAAGEPLAAEPPETVGHAIEVRVYAEDPAHDWQPTTGRIHRFGVGDGQLWGNKLAPGDEKFPHSGRGPRLRVESGVADGSAVSPFYDAMLAKVIVWAPSRAVAAARLAAELARAKIHGVGTNRDLLVWILRHPAFLAGDTDTGVLRGPRDLAPAVDAEVVEGFGVGGRAGGCGRPGAGGPGAEWVAESGVAAAAEELPGRGRHLPGRVSADPGRVGCCGQRSARRQYGGPRGAGG